MTSFSLALGSGLLAFSPTVSLLVLFAYSKAQLVIIVTTAAFAQLISCLLSSLLHLPFTFMDIGTNGIYAIIPTSVLSQAFCRCFFVHLYHKVEHVIERSIQRHEAENAVSNNEDSNTDGNLNNADRDSSNNSSNNNDNYELSETAKLRLELNDISAGLASGVGFGFMHTVMLYGTLLASENSRMGTLYQDSCTFMPSVFNSAIMAFLFAILDIFFMLFTFYAMRRLSNADFVVGNNIGGLSRVDVGSFTVTDLKGGRPTLVLVLVLHTLAAFATTPNQFMNMNGCVIALPSLTLITGFTVACFWFLYKDSYLPEGQRHRIQQAAHSNHLD